MYELGYAIAAGKDTVIISGPNNEKYPFDIQHRGILPYAVGSISDFKQLEQKLTDKLRAILELQVKTTEIMDASPVKESAGLQPHEQTVLALLLANSDSADDAVVPNSLKQEMRKAGYSDVGTRVAIARLIKLGYMKSEWKQESFNSWIAYSITPEGEAWLIENQSRLELHAPRSRPKLAEYGNEISDEDIPF